MKVVISVPFDHGFLELLTCEDTEVGTETDHLHYVFRLDFGVYVEEFKGEIVYTFGEDANTLVTRCMESYARITMATMRQGLAAHELSIH